MYDCKGEKIGFFLINFFFDVFIGFYIVYNDFIGILKVNYMYSILFYIK